MSSARVCPTAADSTWTSHRAYLDTTAAPGWLDVAEGLRRAGFDDRQAFDAWVNHPARADADVDFTEEHYERELQIGRDQELVSTAHAIVPATAATLGLSLEQLRAATLGHAEVLGRSVAVRRAATAGVSGQAIAAALHEPRARCARSAQKCSGGSSSQA